MTCNTLKASAIADQNTVLGILFKSSEKATVLLVTSKTLLSPTSVIKEDVAVRKPR